MKHQQKRVLKKKHKILKVISFIIVSFLLVLSIDAFRTALSTEEFTSRMEQSGFNVEDRTNLFDQVEAHLVADHGAFYIEFMIYETTTEARSAFSQFRSNLENLGGIVSGSWNGTGFNSWYTQTTSEGYYAKMSRIQNTIILIYTTTEYENDVAEVWEMLGQIN